MKYKMILIAVITLMPALSFPQTKISLKEAISIALENNYDIKMTRSDLEIADNSYTLGSAGFLPKLDLTASQSKTSNDTKQAYSDGTNVDKSSSRSTSTNAGIALNWTLFDGLRMFTTYSKLKEYKDLGEMKLRAQLENSIAEVIRIYYDIVRQTISLNAAMESVSISEERVKLTEDKMAIGSASRFDLLRAKIDLNSDKSAMLNQELTLNSLKAGFNTLLARPSSIDFTVDETIDVREGYSFDELKEKALNNNIDLLQSEKNKSISQFYVTLSKSSFYPTLSFNTGYTYSNSEAEAGFFKSSTNTGLSYGLSLSWNLFNGLNNRRDYENALITLDKSELRIQSTRLNVESNLFIAYKNYLKNIEILKLEEENVSIAKENLDLTMDQLKLGTLSAIDFRDVQKNYLNARSRLSSAYYSAKISERDLLKQSGILMQ